MNIDAEVAQVLADIDDSKRIVRDLVIAFEPTTEGMLALMGRIDVLPDDEVRHLVLLLVINEAARQRPADFNEVLA